MILNSSSVKYALLLVFWIFSYIPVVYFMVAPLLVLRWLMWINIVLPFAALKGVVCLPILLQRQLSRKSSGRPNLEFTDSSSFQCLNHFTEFFVIHEKSRYIYYRYFYGLLVNDPEGFTFNEVHLHQYENFQDYLKKKSIKTASSSAIDNGHFPWSYSDCNTTPSQNSQTLSVNHAQLNHQSIPETTISIPRPAQLPLKPPLLTASDDILPVIRETAINLEQLIRLNVNGQEIKLKLKSKPNLNQKFRPLVSYVSSVGVNDYNTISLIKNEIRKVLPRPGYDDGSLAPIILRLSWHCCATYDKYTKTGGSNGGTMRFVPESTDEGNTGLHIAMSALQPVKEMFPEITYSDLWTLAGVVAIESMKGPIIQWKAGRYDCSTNEKVPPNGRLPFGYKGKEHVRETFERMGFDERETVALLGAHGLGRCHKKFSGWEGSWSSNPVQFTNEFFKVLVKEDWKEGTVPETGRKQFYNADKSLMMLNTDLVLLEDANYIKWVNIYADDELMFREDFSKAFAKLLELGIERDQDERVSPTKISV